MQAIAFFVLVLCAPDEGGAEMLWVGLSISFSFVVTVYVQLWLVSRVFQIFGRQLLTTYSWGQGSITLHHTIVVVLLSSLPYVATMAGMNTLASCTSPSRPSSAFPC
jgi:hypothetical protein